MDAFQAIASIQPEHFTHVLGSPTIAVLPSASQSRVLDVVRADRVRVLSILGLSSMSIEPVILRAIAHGWSPGELALALRGIKSDRLQAAARRTGVLRTASPVQ